MKLLGRREEDGINYVIVEMSSMDYDALSGSLTRAEKKRATPPPIHKGYIADPEERETHFRKHLAQLGLNAHVTNPILHTYSSKRSNMQFPQFERWAALIIDLYDVYGASGYRRLPVHYRNFGVTCFKQLAIALEVARDNGEFAHYKRSLSREGDDA